MKVRGMAIYGTTLPRDPGHAPPIAGAGVEHRHRGLGGGGNLRAAVFGVNDGLVSNASLILGVAGASPDRAPGPAHRRRRHVRGRVRDGGRRVRVGTLAARALRIPDRPRARRAQGVSRRRGAGARADLRREGPAGARRPSASQTDRRRSRARARHARARGARAQPRRARLAVGRGDLVVPVLRRRRAAAAAPVHARRAARARCRPRSS